jgi:DNA-binding NarL/FixJ family response regulator
VPLQSFRVNPVFRASGWWHDCGVPETVLLVDDHSGFRAAARKLLETSGFEVVGEAADAQTAITAMIRLRPQVVLVDIQLPDLDGIDLAEVLSTACPDASVVLISSRPAADYGPRLEKSRAAGFISKSELSRDTLTALLHHL